jgi:hypothetical protein
MAKSESDIHLRKVSSCATYQRFIAAHPTSGLSANDFEIAVVTMVKQIQLECPEDEHEDIRTIITEPILDALVLVSKEYSKYLTEARERALAS